MREIDPSPNTITATTTPAKAGVVGSYRGASAIGVARVTAGEHPFLVSREGGSPVWIPAFAGKQSCAGCRTPPAHTIKQGTHSTLFRTPAFQLTYFWYILVV